MRTMDAMMPLARTTTRQTILIAAGTICVVLLSFLILDVVTACVSVLLGAAMLAIAVSDARRFIVPNVLSLPAIPAGLVANGWIAPTQPGVFDVFHYLAAAAVGVACLYALRLLYRTWRGHEGMGLGDVKLAGVAGSWTGFDGLGPTLLLACVLAIGFALIVRGTRPLTATSALPFGAFLAPSIWIVWFALQSFAEHALI